MSASDVLSSGSASTVASSRGSALLLLTFRPTWINETSCGGSESHSSPPATSHLAPTTHVKAWWVLQTLEVFNVFTKLWKRKSNVDNDERFYCERPAVNRVHYGSVCWSGVTKAAYNPFVITHNLFKPNKGGWDCVCDAFVCVLQWTAGLRSVWTSLHLCVRLYVCDGEGQGLIRAFTLNVVNCPVRLSRRCWLDWCPIAKKRGSRGVRWRVGGFTGSSDGERGNNSHNNTEKMERLHCGYRFKGWKYI